MTTNDAIRMSAGMKRLKSEMAAQAQTITAVVENPIVTAFAADVVTASSGQSANSCTNIGFSLSNPFFMSFPVWMANLR